MISGGPFQPQAFCDSDIVMSLSLKNFAPCMNVYTTATAFIYLI